MKKIFKQLLVTMTAIAIATSSIFVGGTTNVAYAAEESVSAGTFSVKCYLNIDGKNQYVGLAQMSDNIKDGNESKYHIVSDNHDVIASSMVSVPSFTKWLAVDEQVVWTKVTFSLTANGGQPGYVAYADKVKMDTKEAAVETFSVKCYVSIDGTNKYVGLAEVSSDIKDGNETKYHIVSSDNGEIARNIVTWPDFSRYGLSSKDIVWTKLTFSLTANGGEPGYVLYAQPCETLVDNQVGSMPVATATPKPTATSTPKPTATSTPKPTATSTPKPTATSTPKPTSVDYSKISTLSGVLLAMLENGEMKTVDISRFRATAADINNAWNTVINGAGVIAYKSAKDIYISGYASKNKYTSILITGMDEDFVSRYELVKKTVAEGLALIQPGMSELDKALILHEYIVDIARYNLNTDGSYKAWGILAYKQGGCMSYTASYNLLLKLAGIECKEYRSGEMNHRWSVVKLDGQWYQVDATWDDTRLSRTGKHYYFLRTDNEFQNVLSSAHYSYGPAFSTDTAVECNSTRFVNWFVHDVMGTIVYNDGFWYFADGNNLMKAHVDGSAMQVVATETAAVTVVKAENGLVTYKAGSTLKTTK